MRTRPFGVVAIVLYGVLLLARLAFAQGSTGSIAGNVKDTTGAALPGVTVEVASSAGGQRRGARCVAGRAEDAAAVRLDDARRREFVGQPQRRGRRSGRDGDGHVLARQPRR